jgi:hypothetical protein
VPFVHQQRLHWTSLAAAGLIVAAACTTLRLQQAAALADVLVREHAHLGRIGQVQSVMSREGLLCEPRSVCSRSCLQRS